MRFMALNFTLQTCNERAQLAGAHTDDAQPQISELKIAFAPVPPPYATQGACKQPGREIKPMDVPRDGTGWRVLPADETQTLNCGF